MSAPLTAAMLRRAGVAEAAIARVLGAHGTAGTVIVGGARGGGKQAALAAAGASRRFGHGGLAHGVALWLPLPPPLTNTASRSSRSGIAIHRARAAYLASCDARLLAALVPPPPAEQWTGVALTIAAVVGRLHDRDNLTARCKPAVDWLKIAGYVADDGPPHLDWTGLPTQQTGPRAMRGLTLTLTPLEADR